ncbi:unnamed protein product [Microthlaspi erraticum]|uniref:Uncharacterized protein n=1 Tax=Microthlaspi erraticum TaxID=1685480 RepID=A0A6D2K422_9BRAS|nr:unnamed protein product [Microthlaspi erraticum]
MQKSMDKMVSKIKSLEKKVSGSSSKKKKATMAPTFPRSRSLLTTPRRLHTQEPHRASSFEPREGEDNSQRRRKSFKARRSNSKIQKKRVFWSILEHMGREEHGGTWHGRSSTGYAKEEGRSHLEDQLDLLDQPVEFLNSTGQASTRSS